MFKFLRLLTLFMLVALSACSKEDARNDGSILSIRSGADNAILHEYNIEIADTKEKMYNGLMGRTSLDENAGFLFDVNIVPKDMDVAMWMKDTLIPLDMLFIDEEGVIFATHANAKPNDVTPIYPPKRPFAVLEINGGQLQKFDIKIGDVVDHPFFKKQ